MYGPAFAEAVMRIYDQDDRYEPDAYMFMQEALHFTAKLHGKTGEGTTKARSVSCSELLEGLRVCALQEMGPMACTVLGTWGIHRTEDFGEIVFNLVAAGELRSTKEDRKEDFENGFDFFEALVKPFLPAAAADRRRQPGRTSSRRPRERQANESGNPAAPAAGPDGKKGVDA